MEIGELFAEKGEPPRYDRSASDNRGSRISPRLVPRPGDVSSGSKAEFTSTPIGVRCAPKADLRLDEYGLLIAPC